MSMIKVSNLTFNYDNHPDNIFENVSFNIDTNWKLGFIGRNGKGKTTFLNLLLGKYEFQISSALLELIFVGFNLVEAHIVILIAENIVAKTTLQFLWLVISFCYTY